MTDLVIVEWYTYERIPRSRHAIVTMRKEALKWIRGGARITLHELLPEVAKEIVWMGP